MSDKQAWKLRVVMATMPSPMPDPGCTTFWEQDSLAAHASAVVAWIELRRQGRVNCHCCPTEGGHHWHSHPSDLPAR